MAFLCRLGHFILIMAKHILQIDLHPNPNGAGFACEGPKYKKMKIVRHINENMKGFKYYMDTE